MADMESSELRAKFEGYLDAFNRLERVALPVVSAVRGRCLGGGFELALRTDVIFAGSSAKFCHPEQTLGIITLLGGIYRVAARAGRARAMEWAMTSEPVPAETMAAAGAVTMCCPKMRCSRLHGCSRDVSLPGQPVPMPPIRRHATNLGGDGCAECR